MSAFFDEPENLKLDIMSVAQYRELQTQMQVNPPQPLVIAGQKYILYEVHIGLPMPEGYPLGWAKYKAMREP